MTAYGTVEVAVEAMKLGAFDFPGQAVQHGSSAPEDAQVLAILEERRQLERPARADLLRTGRAATG
ncbi:MAG: hypothetical protein R3E12_05715 [Candidatus Eisenbacteria bacterium]